jgi:protein O-mannosyl-transferase
MILFVRESDHPALLQKAQNVLGSYSLPSFGPPVKSASMKTESVQPHQPNRMGKRSKRKKVTPREVATKVAETGPVVQQPPFRFNRDWLWGLLLLLAVVLAYLPVWRAGFIWDDDMFISSNPCIVGPLGLKEIWTTSAARFYPFVLTTFWLEHALWGLAPLPYHLVNILLHVTCAVVLWRILRNLEVRGAWLGAALWALHPVQVETVAWISEMKNTESGLFYLLTILFFVRGLKTESHGRRTGVNWNEALSLLCALLAMGSKSSTLLLPVVLALCVWWVKGRWHWRDMTKVGLFLLMSIVVSLIEMQTVKQNGTDEMQWAQSWQERLATGGDVFWVYLGKLIWPHPLITFYPRWEVDAGQWISYLPIATLALVLSVLWLKRQSWGRPYFFAFAYYLLNLLPVLGLFSMTGFRYSLVEDHLQYLASMGPLVLAGAVLSRFSDFAISRKLWLHPAFGAGLLVILGILSWRQTRIYQNEHTFWTSNLAMNPACWLAYDGLGVEFAKNRQMDKATEFYRKSLAINPNYAVTHNNLGVAFAQKGQIDDAIAEYQRALAINPNFSLCYLKLGEALLQKGQVDDAIVQDQKGLDIDSHSILAYNNLGLALVQKGKADEAIAQYQKALDIDPDFAMTHNNLGAAFFQTGQLAKAIEQYKRALEIDSSIILTHNNLGLALTQMGVSLLQAGQVDDAIAQFQEALKNDPTIAQTHSDLGIALAQKGKMDEALTQFQEALRLKPDDNAAQINLAKIKAMLGQKAPSQ